MNKRLLPFLAASCLLAGCVKKNAISVEAVGFCAYPDTGTNCAPSGTCSRYLTGQDFFYLRSTTGLNGPLGYHVEVLNQLPSNETEEGALNSHDAWVEGTSLSYHVDVSQSEHTAAFSLPDDSAGAIEMKVPAGGGTSTPFVSVLPPATLQRLADSIAANDAVLLTIDVSVKLRFGDQSTSETAPVKYWVWVVNAVHPGYVCPDRTQVITDFCGVPGDGAVTFKCSASNLKKISGNVTGLTGTGTTLGIDCNIAGTHNGLAPMTANGVYTCPGANPGDAYTLTITNTGGTATCTFSNGLHTVSGTADADVTADITCG